MEFHPQPMCMINIKIGGSAFNNEPEYQHHNGRGRMPRDTKCETIYKTRQST